jgi:hypothetical protein
MRYIEDLGSAVVVKVQGTKNYKSRSFTILGKFYVEICRKYIGRMDSIIDFTNIIETSSANNKRSRNH